MIASSSRSPSSRLHRSAGTSLLSAAMALIETPDQLDWQGNGLLDLAEVHELAGAPADAAALSQRAVALFERKGNTVSAMKARQLAERLLGQADNTAADGHDRPPRDRPPTA